MTSEAGGAVTLLVGAITLRLALTGDYKRYVKPGMGPLLVIAGLVLVLLGAAVVVQALRGSPAVDGADEDRGHEPERVGWLVLLPVLAVLLVAPPALGAFAVDRTSRIEVTGGALFDPLPVTDAPRALGVVEFLQRAADRDGASMAGATVELTGFVAGHEEQGFELARYTISCCAADAAAAVVSVADTRRAPGRDVWVRVTGAYRPGTTERPVLVASRVEEIPPPDDPYE